MVGPVVGHPASSPAPLALPIDRAWLTRVYSAASPGPVWFTPDGPRPAVAGVLRELRAAADRGLAPEDYDVGALERKVEAAKGSVPDPDALARADVALTATALQFLADLRFGRAQPQRVAPHYRVPAKDAVFVIELRDAVAGDRLGALITAAEPQFPQYLRLKRLLVEYRPLATQPAPSLPPLRRRATRSTSATPIAGTAALHTELVRLGDLAANSAIPADDRYTATLAEGLQRFQARHGLLPDGVLGKDTLAALNEPIAARVGQIVLSLERLRWLPDLPAGPLIAINIPSFRLWAFADKPAPGARRCRCPSSSAGRCATRPPSSSARCATSSSARTGTCRRAFCATSSCPGSTRIRPISSARAWRSCSARRRAGDRGGRRRRHRGAAVGRRPPAPAAGPEERAGRRQVRAAQHHGHLPARDAGARAVRPRPARFQPRLHPRARTGGARVVRASRPARNGRRRRSRQR